MRGQRPLYERIQDWIFALDIGWGANFFRIGLFGMLVGVVIVLYAGTQFFGLREKQAMDMGQLGRNLAMGRGYVTGVVRPLDLYYLNAAGKPTLGAGQVRIPELWTPPGYPVMLGLVFRVMGLGRAAVPATTTKQDRVMMMAGWLFFVTGMVMTYLVSRALFDQQAAVLAVFLYLFCDPLLDDAVSGVPTCFLATLLLLATYALLKADRGEREGRPVWRVNLALAVCVAALGWGTLTNYAMWVLMVPLLVYVGTVFRKRRWRRLGLCVGVFGLVLLPWVVRNQVVSRTWFGLSRYGLLEEAGSDRYRVHEGQFQRAYSVESPWKLRLLVSKSVVNAERLYETTVKGIGGGYVMMFFVASLLHRWREDETLRVRRWWWWGLVGCGLWLCVAGPGERSLMTVFAPLMLIYGAAFFVVMFERLQFRTRLLRVAMVVLFVMVNSVPLVLTVLPPRKTMPYPPYSRGTGADLGRMFREDELLASDIPWAVAWYADRATLWMPGRREDFIEINDRVHMVSGVYLTQATLQRHRVLDEWSGREQFVLRLYQPPAPAGFPLRVYQTMTPDGEQVLLTNRERSGS